MIRRAHATLLAGAIASAACVGYGGIDRSKGFTGSSATVEVKEVPVNGHEVSVEKEGDSVDGELLGLDDTYVYVLDGDRTVAVGRASITSVRIKLYDSGAVPAGIWTGVGTVSTLSHGYWLIFSAPVWLGAGIGTTAALAASNDYHAHPEQLDELAQFARFPQGLPRDWPGNLGAAVLTREQIQRASDEAARRVMERASAGSGDAGSDASALPEAAPPD